MHHDSSNMHGLFGGTASAIERTGTMNRANNHSGFSLKILRHLLYFLASNLTFTFGFT